MPSNSQCGRSLVSNKIELPLPTTPSTSIPPNPPPGNYFSIDPGADPALEHNPDMTFVSAMGDWKIADDPDVLTPKSMCDYEKWMTSLTSETTKAALCEMPNPDSIKSLMHQYVSSPINEQAPVEAGQGDTFIMSNENTGVTGSPEPGIELDMLSVSLVRLTEGEQFTIDPPAAVPRNSRIADAFTTMGGNPILPIKDLDPFVQSGQNQNDTGLLIDLDHDNDQAQNNKGFNKDGDSKGSDASLLTFIRPGEEQYFDQDIAMSERGFAKSLGSDKSQFPGTTAVTIDLAISHPSLPKKRNRVFPCAMCLKTYVHNGNLERHIIKEHPNYISLTNKYESKEAAFERNKEVSDYGAKKAPDKEQDNASSDKVNSPAASLNENTLPAAEMGRTFSCTLCDRKYTHAHSVARHMKTQHSRPEVSSTPVKVRISCPHCKSTFAHNSSHREHIKKFHPEHFDKNSFTDNTVVQDRNNPAAVAEGENNLDDDPTTVSVCFRIRGSQIQEVPMPARFERKRAKPLKGHYPCQCGEIFDLKKSLHRHMNKSCRLLLEKLSSLAGPSSHRMAASISNPLTQHDDKLFQNAQNETHAPEQNLHIDTQLQMYQGSGDEDDGPTPKREKITHSCECGASFSSGQTFRKHVIQECRFADPASSSSAGSSTNSQSLSKSNNNPIFECPVRGCQYTSNNTALGIHIKMHNLDNLPHACEECGKGFTSQSLLVRHQESHRRKVFHCACSQRFLVDMYYQMHIKKCVAYQKSLGNK